MLPSFSDCLRILWTLSKADFVFNGAISLFWLPGPTVNPFVFSIISGIQFYVSPTITETEIAMHLYPVDPKQAPIIAFIASSLSASGIIIAWFLAPILTWALFPKLLAVL